MIWLVGHKGMLGNAVLKKLSEYGMDYVATDTAVDVTDITAIEEFLLHKKISYIINCVAYTNVDKAEEEKELAYNLNREATFNLALEALIRDIPLIHISTDYVYNGEKKGAYTERNKPMPINAYGYTKNGADLVVQHLCNKYFILRTSWLYGENGNNFVYTMMKLFKNKEEVKIVKDQYGSPTYTMDLADFIIYLIKNKCDKYGTYHFTNEGKTNWYDFAVEIYLLMKKNKSIKRNVVLTPILSKDYPTKAKRPKNSYMSKEKVKKTFDIKIRDWQDALREFIERGK